MEELLLGDDIYEVQEIVGIKKSQGRLLYRVRWQGYGAQSDTWEPEENLMLCRDLIQDFVKRRSMIKANSTKVWDSKSPINGEGENQPSAASHDPHDSESESFWQQDMYSRVKGRAAKRHQSRQPIGVTPRSKRGRPHVLQALSQSYDNARTFPTHSRRANPKTNQQVNIERKPQTKEQLCPEQCPERASLHSPSSNSSSTKPLDFLTDVKDHQEIESIFSNIHNSGLNSSEFLTDHISSERLEIKNHSSKFISNSAQVENVGIKNTLPRNLLTELVSAAEMGDTCVFQALFVSEEWKSQAFELMSSARPKQLDVLLRNGANANCCHPVSRTTLLMTACEKGQAEMVRLLLKYGAHKDSTDLVGKTALAKACSGNQLGAMQELLWAGANFASLDIAGCSTNFPLHLQNTLNNHITMVREAFEQQVSCTLSNEVKMLEPLFPLQCFSVSEDTRFQIMFTHKTQAPKPGIGYLLFIAAASFCGGSVQCRLYGSSPVLSVELNGSKQTSLTGDGENFVFPFCPLQDGENVLTILTHHLAKSESKILVCAYNAELTSQVFKEKDGTLDDRAS